MSEQLLQDPSFPLGGWRREGGFKGSAAGNKNFEVKVMNLMAGVGRRSGQSPVGAAGPHVGLVSPASWGPSPLQLPLPCFFFWLGQGGWEKPAQQMDRQMHILNRMFLILIFL